MTRPVVARGIGVLMLVLLMPSIAPSQTSALRTVVSAGQPAPGGGTFEHFTVESQPVVAPSNVRGEVAFFATVRRGRESLEAIYVRAGGRVRKVVAQEDPAPAGGTFAGFGAPALDSKGGVAFAAVAEGRGVPGGVFLAAGDRLRMLAGAGE